MSIGLFSSHSRKRHNGIFNAPVDDQLSEIRDDIAKLAHLLSKRGSEASRDARAKAHDARDHVQDGLGDLMESGEQLLADLRRRYASTETQVRDTVREHPLATLGAAAAVGLLIAAMLRR